MGLISFSMAQKRHANFEPLSESTKEVETVFDEGAVYSYSLRKRFWTKRKIIAALLLLASILCVLVCGGAIGLGLALGLGGPHYPPAPDYVHDDDILQTVEYQITLNPKEAWSNGNREQMVADWIVDLNTYNSYYVFNRSAATEEVYTQFTVEAAGNGRCQTPQDMMTRYRQFSDRAEFSIKRDIGGSRNKVCAQPFWPNENIYPYSKQKCEEDVHPCFDKYSRGTTLVFPGAEGPEFTACGQLVKLFPDAFPEIEQYQTQRHPLTKGKESHWWKLQWKGVMGERTHFEATFTVAFPTEQHALDGEGKIIQGEFSLRFYTEKNQKWEPEVNDALDSLFYNMILRWDTIEDHLTCAHQYFLGKNLNHVGYDKKQHADLLS